MKKLHMIPHETEGMLITFCGLDGCGIMLTSIEEDKVHFAGVGGINAEYLIGKKIIFDDGNIGIVRFDGKDKTN
jgi:putative aminopeptidase FrvX